MRTFRLLVFTLYAACMAQTVYGQDLAEMYRDARFRVQASRYLLERGGRAAVLPPAHLPSGADTLRAWIDSKLSASRRTDEAPEALRFDMETWRLVRRLERGWFMKKFRNTLWAYLGTENVEPLDTTYTRELRARMEAFFGPPTQTLAEMEERYYPQHGDNQLIQFEYWFVLNDTIPFILLDVNGPLERGLVSSTDQKYREILLQLRAAFLDEFETLRRMAPYVDYYYDEPNQSWYRTGYDGRSFFLEKINAPNLVRGRPWIRGGTGSE